MPRKRAVPEYISHMIMAKEYTSAALVSFPSLSSSGEQYDTVPADIRNSSSLAHAYSRPADLSFPVLCSHMEIICLACQ